MKCILLIDGSNCVHYYYKNGKKFASGDSLKIIERFFSQLRSKISNLTVLFMVDSTLKFTIDKPRIVYQLIESEKIIESPKFKKADEILLNMYAFYHNCSIIISNDQFREYPIVSSFKENPWRLSLHQRNGKITIPGFNAWIRNINQ